MHEENLETEANQKLVDITDSAIVTAAINRWQADLPFESTWQRIVEQGKVLYCPLLAFDLRPDEKRFLDPGRTNDYTNEKRKSVYIRSNDGPLFGSESDAQDQALLLALLQRYRAASMGLIAALFPGYVGKMQAASTSFRPRAIGSGAAALSWRKDDTRLHVDAFPSNPTNGMRILRVFNNVGTTPRIWRVGQPFATMASHFLPHLRGPLPGSARLLHALHITKRRRSPYDHFMLQLHDAAKADLAYQKDCEQITFHFPPGSTWICYSDQVMHAAMSGQFMMEQTIHVPMAALAYPEQSPLQILQRLTGKAMLV